MHWHAQNLNELPEGDGHPFFHGRAWLRFAEESGWGLPGLCFTWRHALRQSAALVLRFDRDDGREVLFHVAVPPFSYYLAVQGLPKALFERLPFKHLRTEYEYMGGNRSIGIRIFDAALWWSLWEDDHESRSSDPWWMRGRIGLDDLAERLFGREVHESRVLEEREVTIPMPERGYPAKVEVTVSTWKRPRFPWWPLAKRRVGSTVSLERPPAVPGKGESSWNCGPDAIYAMSCGATTVEEAIGQYVGAALRTRQRHGGSHSYDPGPEPESEVAAGAPPRAAPSQAVDDQEWP